MKIALDAMGGDYAPTTNIDGAIEALDMNKELSIVLVGDEAKISSELKKRNCKGLSIEVKHASQVVDMEDSPLSAIRRKKDSSIRVAIDLVKAGKADAMISAGNSGVVMATALLILGKLPGIERPAIAAIMPSLKDHFVLIDAGANVDCKPLHLYQFGIMGDAYARCIFDIDSPKVGMLSIGEEDIKGNELTKEALKLLKDAHVNFIGNIEGKDIFEGEADVVVCDGFVGNITLKVSEGLAETMSKMLKKEIMEKVSGKIDPSLLKEAFKNFKHRTDYSEYGGAPLLGISKPCIISHGRSTSNAIKNAIRVAGTFQSKGVLDVISREINQGLTGRESIAIEK